MLPWYYSFLRMYFVYHKKKLSLVVGCSMCGMFGMSGVQNVGCLACRMFGMLDVQNVGCSRCGVLGMWDVGNMKCSGCGMFDDVGCSRSGMFGMWDVWDVRCLGCGMWIVGYRMWDVRCLPRCEMLIYKMLFLKALTQMFNTYHFEISL